MTGGLAPQAPCRAAVARRGLTLLPVATVLWLAGGGQTAAAGSGQKVRVRGQDPDPPSHFVALGALGGAVRTEGAWDTSFGGEIAVGELRQRGALAAWAFAIGFSTYSERDGGRVSGEVAAGTRWLGGILVGASAGPVVALDQFRRPRWGGEGSLWLYAGLVPYVRIGAISDGGGFVDIGVRIPLPRGALVGRAKRSRADCGLES